MSQAEEVLNSRSLCCGYWMRVKDKNPRQVMSPVRAGSDGKGYDRVRDKGPYSKDYETVR